MRRRLFVLGFLAVLALNTAQAQAPVTDFSVTPTSGCAPIRVYFKDLSTNSPTAWNWDFGNGDISNQQNPNEAYQTPGSYTVTLIARNASGATVMRKTGLITVYASPNPNFTANLQLACTPASIQFTDRSTPGQGSITAWNWSFGDGSTSNQQNPTHNFTQTGYYNISLSVTNSGGCTYAAYAARYLRVVDGIQPNFDYDQTSSACTAPYIINFINQTAGPGNLTYTWSLGTNAVPANSTDTSPANVTYPSAGTYNVNLQVNSSLGCSQSVQKTLSFSNNSAVLNGPTTTCVNAPTTFSNGSSPLPPTTTWDFGDGTGATTNNVSKTFTTPGSYPVKLVNKYAGCADSVTQTVQVLNPPVPAFTASPSPAAACKPSLSVSFTDNTTPTPTGWLWNFGDGSTSNIQNPTHNYTTTGSFDVTLTVTGSGSCSGTATQTGLVQIQPPTVVINKANTLGACVTGSPAGAVTTLQPTTTVTSLDPVTAYAWSAPGSNEGSSSVATPTFTYNTAGTYSISVTVTAGACTSASATSTVQIGTSVPADFTIDQNPVCGSDSVTFSILTPPPAGATVFWQFGDGVDKGPGTAFTIRHSYKKLSPPPVTVTLTTVNSGCPTVQTHTLIVNPPIPNFGYGINCTVSPLSVNFSDSTVQGAATTFSWDFGDGSPLSTVENPSHTYTGPGKYNVTLTATDGACSVPITKTITLGSINASFDIAPASAIVCRSQAYQLISTSTVTPPLDQTFIAAYYWEVGAGEPYTQNASTYNSYISSIGNTALQLLVTDINGCSYYSPVKNIQVTGPVANFAAAAPGGGCKNTPVTFTDKSIPYPGDAGPPPAPPSAITSWSWDFGDGATLASTAPPFPHQYADTGSYIVKLKVTDASGCTDTITIPNAIQITTPIANFSGPDSFYCPGVPLPFVDSSKGYGLTDAWVFGDGQTSTQPVNTYAPGSATYNVTLTVTDKYNCTASITKPVRIQAPIAAFDISDTTAICTPLQTKFTAHGQYYGSLYWDFGDGQTSTLPVTSHFYNTTDTFTAKLFVEGPGGCFDSASRRVLVLNPNTTTTFTYSPLKACDSVPVQFEITPPGYTNFSLAFGDNTGDSSGNETPFHMYRSPSNYQPTLTLTDATGCIVPITGAQGVITVLGAVPFFSPSTHAFCDSGTVQFTDYTFSNDGLASETYNFGDGSPTTAETPGTGAFTASHYYDQPGNFPASLKVTTNSGCTETYTDTIRDYQTPHPTITTAAELCTGFIQFQGGLSTTQVDTVQWNWNFGNGQTSGLQDPLIKMAPGIFTVTLLATVPPIGCNDTTSTQVTVNPLPTISGPHTITTPVGIPITIPFTYSSGLVSYTWTPATNLDCTTCPNPVATLIFSTQYAVSVTDANGCMASDTILINTICNDLNYFLPNTFTPNGDGVNDYFYPRGSNLYNIQSLTIFNRWGQMVFQRRDFPANASTMGWDGTFNGHPAPADAYVYVAEVVCDNGQVVALHGNVTLIR